MTKSEKKAKNRSQKTQFALIALQRVLGAASADKQKIAVTDQPKKLYNKIRVNPRHGS